MTRIQRLSAAAKKAAATRKRPTRRPPQISPEALKLLAAVDSDAAAAVVRDVSRAEAEKRGDAKEAA